MDTFEIAIEKNNTSPCQDQPITIKINGISLQELIREVETPFVQEENVEIGLPKEDILLLDGYSGLSVKHALWPSKVLLGEPWNREGWIKIKNDDPAKHKSNVLNCSCGDEICWPLLVDIIVDEKTITWKSFCQFHRDWIYDVGPFNFDRNQYETELKKYRI